MPKKPSLPVSCVAAVSLALLSSLTTTFAQTPAASPASTTPSPPPAKPSPTPMDLTTTPAAYRTITNGPLRYDTQGKHINVHGGGVLFHNGTYYWYGEYRNPRQEGVPGTAGVGCYTSKDLYNWENKGVVLPVVENDPNHDITAGCVIERPKVIHNSRTGKFVMWFHLELKGRGYGAARTALAVSDKPLGPFTFVRSLRPNAGKWPIDFSDDKKKPLTKDETKKEMEGRFRPALIEGAYTRRDFEGGQMARDMTLFVDDDGKAYHVASAEENFTLNIHELTSDYLDFTGKWTRVEPGGHNEAPAIVKHKGKYHLLASGCTGWDPNDARVLVADSIWGPWKRSHNPCQSTNPWNKMGPNKTWGGQSTHIFTVHGKRDAYVAMFDVWRPKVQLIESGHIWLPIEFENDRMVIRWRDEWDLSVFQ